MSALGKRCLYGLTMPSPHFLPFYLVNTSLFLYVLPWLPARRQISPQILAYLCPFQLAVKHLRSSFLRTDGNSLVLFSKIWPEGSIAVLELLNQEMFLPTHPLLQEKLILDPNWVSVSMCTTPFTGSGGVLHDLPWERKRILEPGRVI